MIENKIEVKIVDSWKQDDIVALYMAGGWWKDSYDPSGIDQLIEGSFAFAVAIDKSNQNAVGMGRLISDGVSDAYIQDLIVLNDYRKKGIGRMIVKILIDYCLEKKIHWIGLISEPDQDGFYLNLGFRKMQNYEPMKYHIED